MQTNGQAEFTEINKAAQLITTTDHKHQKQIKLRTDEIQRVLNNVSDLKTRGRCQTFQRGCTTRPESIGRNPQNDLKRVADVQVS